jgi:hypothetical protein
MDADELDEAPRTPGLLAYENEPIHLPLGVTIDHLDKVGFIKKYMNSNNNNDNKIFI